MRLGVKTALLSIISLYLIALSVRAQAFHLTEFDYCMDLRRSIVHVKDFSRALVYRQLTEVQIDELNKAHSTDMNHFRDYHCAKLIKHKIH